MITHSSILTRKIPWTEEPAGYSPWGHGELDRTQLSNCACMLKQVQTEYKEIYKEPNTASKQL